jgi:ATPase subunit of ABC transporter with duplicated ATPase domains
LKKGDKVAVISKNSLAITEFFQILSGNTTADKGTFNWGITTNQSYMPLDNASFFQEDISLVDWLRQFTKNDEERHEEYMRGFLGKMLFSGDEALKSCTVLSGGEKMRCMFSRMMLQRANILLMDEPTNHLDLESITTLNNSLVSFKGNILLSSHDHEMLSTVCNRVIELTPKGIIDREMTYDEYLEDKKIKELQKQMYS